MLQRRAHNIHGVFSERIPAEVLAIGAEGNDCVIRVIGTGDLGKAEVGFDEAPVLLAGQLARMYMRMDEGQ